VKGTYLPSAALGDYTLTQVHPIPAPTRIPFASLFPKGTGGSGKGTPLRYETLHNVVWLVGNSTRAGISAGTHSHHRRGPHRGQRPPRLDGGGVPEQ
jgi:hypothetical protein